VPLRLPVDGHGPGLPWAAAIHGAERALAQGEADRPALLQLLDDDHALWRCHTAWECTAVCPSSVYPAEAIMRMRRVVIGYKIKRLFGVK